MAKAVGLTIQGYSILSTREFHLNSTDLGIVNPCLFAISDIIFLSSIFDKSPCSDVPERKKYGNNFSLFLSTTSATSSPIKSNIALLLLSL